MNHSSQSHTIQVLQITDGGELRDVRNMENIFFFTSCVKQRLSKDSYNRSLWSTTPCKTLNLEEVRSFNVTHVRSFNVTHVLFISTAKRCS